MVLQKLTVNTVSLNMMENQEKLKEIASRILEKANYESDDSVESDEHGSVIAVIMVISTMLTLIRVFKSAIKIKIRCFMLIVLEILA